MNRGLILPNILDDLDNNEDVHSELDGSQQRAYSVQVLEDLGKLSRSMMEWKRRLKSTQSSTLEGSPRKRRKGGGSNNGLMSGSGGLGGLENYRLGKLTGRPSIWIRVEVYKHMKECFCRNEGTHTACIGKDTQSQ